MVNYDCKSYPGLSEAIEILDVQVSQLQQPQIHLIQQKPQYQQPAQEQQQIPIPENLNSESDCDSNSEQDNQMDIYFTLEET